MAAMIFYVPFFYRKTGTHALQTSVAHHLRAAKKRRGRKVRQVMVAVICEETQKLSLAFAGLSDFEFAGFL